MNNKQSLDIYRNKEKPKWEWFYEGTWECSLLFKTRSGALETKDRIRRWNENNRWCESCLRRGEQIRENIKHIVVECRKYDNERRELNDRILEKIDERDWEARKQEEDQGLSTILGFREKDQSIIKASKEFLKKVWKLRSNGEQREEEPERDHNYYNRN